MRFFLVLKLLGEERERPAYDRNVAYKPNSAAEGCGRQDSGHAWQTGIDFRTRANGRGSWHRPVLDWLKPTTAAEPCRRELLFMLRVFGRLPVTDRAARSEGRRPKSLRGGNRGGVCGGSGVGLWGFSACVCPHLSVSNGDPRLSNHHGVGFGRRVQDRNGGLVVSDLRFGGRRRD